MAGRGKWLNAFGTGRMMPNSMDEGIDIENCMCLYVEGGRSGEGFLLSFVEACFVGCIFRQP